MDIYQLLDEGERYKLSILRYLELIQDEYITLSRLEEVMGLSHFKVSNYLNELVNDLYQFEDNPRILIYSDEIVVKNINLKTVKELQITYFKQSHTMQLLLFLLEGRGTIEKFSENNFVSPSKTYSRRKEIVKFFNKYTSIKIQKNIIDGNEIELRNIIFSLLSESFNGYYFPFSEENKVQTNQLVDYFTSLFNLRLTPTQNKKLRLFISIIVSRIQTNKTIEQSFFKEEDSNLLSTLKFLKKIFPNTPRKALLAESSYVLLYLLIEYDVKGPVIQKIDFSLFSENKNLSTQISQKIIREVELAYHFKCPDEIKKKYSEKLVNINLEHQYFEFYSSSFSTKKQIQFIYETYPIYSQVVEKVVLEYIDYFSFTHNNMSIRLFYDYIFLLIHYLPLNVVERPIHVCVDFSQGTNYTEYIIKQVEGFETLNLVVERQLTAKTDIFISDYLLDNLIRKQIIWKNPPTPTDWKFFGDTVVSIKKSSLLTDKEGGW
ncbi:BglG family transcription antiterminator [Enterococcus faecalis]|uniref:M protein trans-acting positive regulator n=1 Tax=Enterococcus faecalis TaxID=1351 RepID=UPI00299E1D00|nr:M protein trans-acting positive regulator [Enterococcus faecalis]